MTDSEYHLTAIDILINRQNIALARSQKLLQSWLPPKPSSQPTSTTADSDDEDDLQDLGEATGVGAKRKTSDDSELGGILKRRRTDNDKLLENLIGKKAAQARKKAQAQAHEAEKSKHSAPRTLELQGQKRGGRPVESEGEEEEGRASLLGSRKRGKTRGQRQLPADVVADAEHEELPEEHAETVDSWEDAAVMKQLAREADDSNAEDERPKKRKTGSYLDELLAQKAKKKSKKKKKGPSTV